MTRHTRIWPVVLPIAALLVTGGCARTVAGEPVAGAPTASTTSASPTATSAPPSTSSGPGGCDVSLMDDGDSSRYEVTSRGGGAETRSSEDGLFIRCGGGPQVRVQFSPGEAVLIFLDGERFQAAAGQSATVGPYLLEVASVDATSAMFSLTLAG